MKNAFDFTLKDLFVLTILKFLSWLLGHVKGLSHLKDKIDFKIYDVTAWLTDNCITYTDQYLKK